MSPTAKEKPAPLVPDYVDLSSLEYMPLYIAKLRGSKAWLVCKRRPELAYYLQNLWMTAWQERPAGSIEADDDVMAEAAKCGTFELWVDLKSELLRGWVMCSDGRYYCRSMVPMVQRGWKLVTGKRKAGKAGADARWGDGTSHSSRHGTSHQEPPIDNTAENGTSHSSRYGREGGREGGSKGKGRAHAPQNGHDRIGAITDAWQFIRVSAASGQEPDLPQPAAEALAAIGGYAALRQDNDPERLRHLQSEFARAYPKAEH